MGRDPGILSFFQRGKPGQSRLMLPFIPSSLQPGLQTRKTASRLGGLSISTFPHHITRIWCNAVRPASDAQKKDRIRLSHRPAQSRCQRTHLLNNLTKSFTPLHPPQSVRPSPTPRTPHTHRHAASHHRSVCCVTSAVLGGGPPNPTLFSVPQQTGTLWAF